MTLNKYFFILFFCFITIISYINDDYTTSMVIELIIWSLFAMSFNIIYGYTGLLSFGQAIFFGSGCYSFALLSVYSNISILSIIGLSIVFSFILSVVTGVFIIRVVSHYFVILTVLLSLILFHLANHLTWLTGGDDGLPINIPLMTVGTIEISLYDQINLLWIIAVFFLLLFTLYSTFLHSPLGLILQGVRENELKIEFLGYNAKHYRYLAWCISGTLAGISGILYTLSFKYASSLYFHWTVSGEAVVWTIIGGKGTLFGPILGTTILLLTKDILSTEFDFYPILVSGLLIFFIRFKPQGIIGIISYFTSYKYKVNYFNRINSVKTPQPIKNINLATKILDVNGISKSFGGIDALKNISFSINKNGINLKLNTGKNIFIENKGKPTSISFIGPNGAGKTTLFNILSGLYSPECGDITALNNIIFNKTKRSTIYDIVKFGIVRSFQNVQIFPDLTVEENLLIAIQLRINPWAISQTRDQKKTTYEQLLEALTETNLLDERRVLAKNLSYGRQKMLEMALLMALGGEIFIIDEPTAGVSPKEIKIILNLIDKLSDRYSILLIEHDLDIIRKLNFVTFVMDDGEIIAAGTPEDVLNQSYVREKFYV